MVKKALNFGLIFAGVVSASDLSLRGNQNDDVSIYTWEESLANMSERNLGSCGVTGNGCSVFNQCCDGFSCQPIKQKCYPKIRDVGQPCFLQNKCSRSISNIANYGRCNWNVCDRVYFHPPAQTLERAPGNRNGFDLAIIADIQLGYYQCQGKEAECIFSRGWGNPKQVLSAAIDRVFSDVKSFKWVSSNFRGVVFNGDLIHTSTDDKSEYEEKMKSLVGIDVFTGLGNHDLWEDSFTDKVRRDMITYLVGQVKALGERGLVKSFDFFQSADFFDSNYVEFQQAQYGSMAYEFEINGYVFIMLHWAYQGPSENGREYATSFNGFDIPGRMKREYYYILPATNWLVKRLRLAKAQEKPVVLIHHSFLGLQNAVDTHPELAEALYFSTVFAIFSGHLHAAYSENPYSLKIEQPGLNTRSVKALYTGAPSYNKYMRLSFEPNQQGISAILRDVGSFAKNYGAVERIEAVNLQDKSAAQFVLLSRANSGCMTAYKNSRNLEMQKCIEGAHQTFYLDLESRIRTSSFQYCVNYDYGTGNISTERCRNSNNQRWVFEGEQIRSAQNNQCLEVKENGKFAVASCNQRDSQTFGRRAVGIILSKSDDSMCIDVDVARSDAIMFPCHQNQNQQFYFAFDGYIKSLTDENQCLDYNYYTGNVYMYSCHEGRNQQWYLTERMELKTRHNSLCLNFDLKTRNLSMRTCTGRQNQKFLGIPLADAPSA